MTLHRKKPSPKLLALLPLLLIVGCATSLPPTPPPVVVQQAATPKLSPDLLIAPLPSGAYLQRAEQREEAMRESLKTSPAK